MYQLQEGSELRELEKADKVPGCWEKFLESGSHGLGAVICVKSAQTQQNSSLMHFV